MVHPVHGPLVGDEPGHAHLVASLTHRTTDRFNASRSIRRWAFSVRNRFSSATSPVENPCVPPFSAVLSGLARNFGDVFGAGSGSERAVGVIVGGDALE
jgi:hypothetical protein